MKTQRWQDWAMLIFGAWIFFSPFWMPGYASSTSVAALNSYILGILVAGFAWAALASWRRWEEWVQLALGVWLVVSPFLLGYYSTEQGAAWNHIVLGILVGADAAWSLVEHPGRPVGTA